MDPVTHALAGCAIADAGFRGRLGPRAVVAAALVAAAPDIDVYFRHLPGLDPVGAFADIIGHRSLTHCFLPQALAAAPLGWLAWRYAGRCGHWGWWMLLASLALFSHSLLDCANPWGTRLWLPFSDVWSSWDALPIFDVWVTGALLLSFAVNRVAHWRRAGRGRSAGAAEPSSALPGAREVASSALGAGSAAPCRLAGGFALATLIGLCGYTAYEAAESDRLVDEYREEWGKEGFHPSRIRAIPVMFTTRLRMIAGVEEATGGTWLAYRGVVRPGMISVMTYDFTGPDAPPPEMLPLVEAALATPRGAAARARTGGLLRPEVAPLPEGGHRVLLHDLRLAGVSRPRGGSWRAWQFDFDAAGRLVAQDQYMRRPRDWRAEWDAYRRLVGD